MSYLHYIPVATNVCAWCSNLRAFSQRDVAQRGFTQGEIEAASGCCCRGLQQWWTKDGFDTTTGPFPERRYSSSAKRANVVFRAMLAFCVFSESCSLLAATQKILRELIICISVVALSSLFSTFTCSTIRGVCLPEWLSPPLVQLSLSNRLKVMCSRCRIPR